MGMESIRQEKYPQPNKKAKNIDCYGYGEHKTGKIPTAKQKRQQKINCYGYVRTENNKNTHQ